MKQLEGIPLLLDIMKSNDVKALTLMEYCCARLLSENSQLLRLSDKCHKIEESFKKTLPFHLNVISAAARGKLKETAHSIILHDLLHHPAVLSSFLEEIIGVDGNMFSISDIEYPDKNRIDLSLNSKEKFLIIENKVNSAEEQKGQLYRYYSIAKESHSEDNIIILYLNPSTNEPPSLYSRSENGSGAEDDRDTVKVDKIIVKNYVHDILGWLSKLAESNDLMSDDEPYLKSAVIQYVDYLEEYFQTKDKYKQLHEMIEKELKEVLGIENSQSRESQIEILIDKKASLEKMLSEVDRFLNKLQEEQATEIFESAARELNEKFKGAATFKMVNYTNPEMGFDIKVGNQLLHATIIFTGQKYWWRIYSTSGLEETTKLRILELITPVMGTIKGGGSGQWDIYNSTSPKNCGLRLSQLADLFINASDFIVV